MSNSYEQCKEDFQKNNLYERVEISWKEYNELDESERLKGNNDANMQVYYKVIPAEISDSDRNNYVYMKLLENIRLLNEKIYIMKNIMVFWLILSIIGIIGSIYAAVKMAELFSRLG